MNDIEKQLLVEELIREAELFKRFEEFCNSLPMPVMRKGTRRLYSPFIISTARKDYSYEKEAGQETQ